MIIAMFIVVLVAIIGGLFLWTKKQKRKQLKEFEELAKLAAGADVAPSADGASSPSSVAKEQNNPRDLKSITDAVRDLLARERANLPPAEIKADPAQNQAQELIDCAELLKKRAREVYDAEVKYASLHKSADDCHDKLRSAISLAAKVVDNMFQTTVVATSILPVDAFNSYLETRISNLLSVGLASKSLSEAIALFEQSAPEFQTKFAELKAMRKRFSQQIGENVKLPPILEKSIYVADQILGSYESTYAGVKEKLSEVRAFMKTIPQDAASKPITVSNQGDIIPAFRLVYENYFSCLKSWARLKNVIAELDGSEKAMGSIREPQKPTDEEVRRYLSETTETSRKRLALKRTLGDIVTNEYKVYTKSLEESMSTLKSILTSRHALRSPDFGDSATVLKNLRTAKTKEEAIVIIARQVLEEAQSLLVRLSKAAIDNNHAELMDRTVANSTVSADERKIIDVMLPLFRKLGFAVAQSLTAERSINALNGQLRSYQSAPSIYAPNHYKSFDLYLADFEVRFAAHDLWQREKEKLLAEQAVAEAALLSRQQKQLAVIKLIEQTRASYADVIPKVGCADEFRILNHVAGILIVRHKVDVPMVVS